MVDRHLTGLARTIVSSPPGSDLFAQPLGPLRRRRSVLQLASKALSESLDVMPVQPLRDSRRDRLDGVLWRKPHRDEIRCDLDPLVEKGHRFRSTRGTGDMSGEPLDVTRGDAARKRIRDRLDRLLSRSRFLHPDTLALGPLDQLVCGRELPRDS